MLSVCFGKQVNKQGSSQVRDTVLHHRAAVGRDIWEGRANMPLLHDSLCAQEKCSIEVQREILPCVKDKV